MQQVLNRSHILWQKCPLPLKILGIVSMIGLGVRLIPYFVPVRSPDIAQTDQAFTFYDRHGLRLGTVLTQDQNHTSVVTLAEISPLFQQAILAAEDKNFYHHGALDLKAIARSVQQAIKHREIVSGASTITMQLARMLEPNPRTPKAKLQEIWLSWRLVAGMNKQEILTAYINRLPMGGNIYGVEAAARIYFGVPAADLNLAQATLLASLPNNPIYLNPYDYWDTLKIRQQYVLERMVTDGYVTPIQAKQAFAEEVTLQPRHQGIETAPHFLFWLASQLDTQTNPSVKTTLDLELQQFVAGQVEQIVQALGDRQVSQAAAIVLDNHTGDILAYVGSRDYFGTDQLGRNDGVQALRQPGSTLKPFLYQLALEKRIIHPNTVLADIPTYYAIPGAKLYTPTDYSETFLGPVRVRVALANSLNIPAVRVLEQIGVATFLQRLQTLGFVHLNEDADHYGLGLTLGSGEVSLMELAKAYRTLALQGQQGRLRSYFGQDLEAEAEPISEPSSWQLVTDMLGDRHARATAFGVDSALNLPFPTAVKTGTSSNYRDTWTVGFSRDYTVATWVGNFDGTPMRQVSGVMGAAPLWREILLHLHETNPPRAFDPPQGMVSRPVCALSGKKPTSLCPTVVTEYFYPVDLARYEAEPDDFYQEIAGEVRLTLPSVYDSWLASQGELLFAAGGLKILTPNNGDRFVVDANDPNPPQLNLRLQTAGDEPVQWFLNGQAWQPASLKLPLRPGQWQLMVKQGSLQHQVNFSVEAQAHQGKRGFSVGEAGGI